MSKTKSTKGYIVACMNCHQQLGTIAYTKKESDGLIREHLFGGGDKNHTGHVMTRTETTIVRATDTKGK